MPRMLGDISVQRLTNYFQQTAWGTRDGADDDDGYRMRPVVRKQQEAGNAFTMIKRSSYQNEKCEYWPAQVPTVHSCLEIRDPGMHGCN